MWLILLCLVLVLSCGKGEGKRENQNAQRPVAITTYTISRSDLQMQYETKGYFESIKDLSLKPDMAGRVLEVYVEEGSFVNQGQVLLKMDPSEYENTLRQLQAQLAQARVNYENQKALVERRKTLFERELIAKEEYDNSLAQLRAQEELINSISSQIANVKLQLSKTTLKAPFSGYIAQRFVNVGDYINSQFQTFRLTTLNPLRVVFQIPQELLSFAKLGKEVNIEASGLGVYKGKLTFVSPVADQNRLITLKATVDNKDNLLKPGMFALVSLPTEKVPVFVVPERALVLKGTKKIVWKVEGNTAIPVEVELVRQEGGKAYIKGNLKEGEKIALENAYILREGVKVEIIQ